MRDLRPKAFAATELFLDLVHIVRSHTDLDLDSLVIMFSINEATMRPLMLNPHTPKDARLAPAPPEEYRGSISMLAVAERVGLPRETVRRKTKALVEAGLVIEDSRGRYRAKAALMEERTQQVVREAHAAVKRYDKRLRQLGRPGIGGPSEG